MRLPEEIVSLYEEMVSEVQSISLIGFTSTHKNRQSAESDALRTGCELDGLLSDAKSSGAQLQTVDESVPVLIEIVCRTSLRCFEINRLEFSPYHKHDDEVLFLDGNCLKVLSVDKNAQITC